MTTAVPPESSRLFASGMNDSSGVSTCVKLSSVNCVGIFTDSDACVSTEASTSQSSGTAKHTAMTSSTTFDTQRMVRPRGEVMCRAPGAVTDRVTLDTGRSAVRAMVSPPPA